MSIHLIWWAWTQSAPSKVTITFSAAPGVAEGDAVVSSADRMAPKSTEAGFL